MSDSLPNMTLDKFGESRNIDSYARVLAVVDGGTPKERMTGTPSSQDQVSHYVVQVESGYQSAGREVKGAALSGGDFASVGDAKNHIRDLRDGKATLSEDTKLDMISDMRSRMEAAQASRRIPERDGRLDAMSNVFAEEVNKRFPAAKAVAEQTDTAKLSGSASETLGASPTGEKSVQETAKNLHSKVAGLTSMMQTFHNHPEIKAATENADKYGMTKENAIHQAMDRNPALRDMYDRIHNHFAQHVKPAIDQHEANIEKMTDPKAKQEAMGDMHKTLANMKKSADGLPHPDDVADKVNKAVAGKHPSLSEVLGHIVQRLGEKLGLLKPAGTAPSNAQQELSSSVPPQRPSDPAQVAQRAIRPSPRRGP